MNEIPTVVVSKTLPHAHWPETQIARGELSDEIGRLKREPGNDLIAYGGATFDQALSRLGLVDEYRLMIHPAALGAGLSLFKDLRAPLHLELVEATMYPTGLGIHVYRLRSSPAGHRVDPDPSEQVGSARVCAGRARTGCREYRLGCCRPRVASGHAYQLQSTRA
jgi:dihydrofolate reductase